jgi:hypothetical protein
MEYDYPPGSEEANEAAAARRLCTQLRRRIQAERVGSSRENFRRGLYEEEVQTWWEAEGFTAGEVSDILHRCEAVQEAAGAKWVEKFNVLA